MKRPYLVVILVFLLLLGGATAARSWRRRTLEVPALPDESIAVIAELRRENARLREEMTRARFTAGVAAVSAAAVRARVNDQREPPMAQAAFPPPAIETPNISDQDLLERTEGRFRSEGSDPLWSAGAEVAARRHLSPATSDQGQLQGLECHSSICRAEIVYRDRKTYDVEVERTITDVSTWHGGSTSSPPREHADGKIEVVQYLFKEGEDPERDIYEEEEARLASLHEL